MTHTIEWEAPTWPPISDRPPAAVAPAARRATDAVPRISTVAHMSPGPHVSAVLVLLPLRIFLAAGWLRAAVEKLISAKWWGGSELRSFLTDHHSTALPYFRPLMDHAFDPCAIFVGAGVAILELACGIALVTGRFMRTALYIGVVLNVSFVLCGQVNPSAFYLVMEIALLFAIADGAIGVAPRRPGRRTLVAAAGWILLSVTFVPYIRTMKPADVITDPAIMLAFLSMITAAGLVLRWVVAAPDRRDSRMVSRWVGRIDAWAHANHAPRPGSSVAEAGRRADL